MTIAKRKQPLHGFTIVELAVVIAVIGILAALIVVSVGSWRTRVAASEVKSDLINAKSAMESARNFGTGYPTSIPANFTSSKDVAVTYVSGDDKDFCIDGRSTVILSVYYFIDSARTGDSPKPGTCAAGELTGPPLAGGPDGSDGGSSGVFMAGDGADQIAAGASHSCAITDGKVYCWGTNTFGQLGNNSTATSGDPVAVDVSGALNGKTATAVAIGQSFSCAIADSEVYCWGSNTQYTLGSAAAGSGSLVPVSINVLSPSNPLNGKTVTAIAINSYTPCVIADGEAYCWGANSYGEFGDNSKTGRSTPTAVTATGFMKDKTVTQITRLDTATCALADGVPYCWGTNTGGVLGTRYTTDKLLPNPVYVDGALSGKAITALSGGSKSVCVVAGGAPYCWGKPQSGMLGNGTVVGDQLAPGAVDATGVLNGKVVTAIDVGPGNACVVAGGKGYCWGNGAWGATGDGNSKSYDTVPVTVDTSGVLSNKTLTKIYVGGVNAFTTVGSDTYGWGRGPLGNGSNSNVAHPFPVLTAVR